MHQSIDALTTALPGTLALPESDLIPLLMIPAAGVQIYRATADGSFALVGPEATLFDGEGRRIGWHYQGPTWEHRDGSRIVCEVAAKSPAPASAAIPWLLLRVVSAEGEGALFRACYLHRVDTAGGVAPSGPAAPGTEVRVPYRAVYWIWARRTANDGPTR